MLRVISYVLLFLLLAVIPTAGVNNEVLGVCYPEQYSIELTDNRGITSYSYESGIIHSGKTRPITVNSTLLGIHYSGGKYKCGYEVVAGFASLTVYHDSDIGIIGILTFGPGQWNYMSSSDQNKTQTCHAKYFPITPRNISIGNALYHTVPLEQSSCPFPSNCTVADSDIIIQFDMITRCWP